jgi:hypothetical protein
MPHDTVPVPGPVPCRGGIAVPRARLSAPVACPVGTLAPRRAARRGAPSLVPSRRYRAVRWRGEEGASATETVIVTPLLLVLLLLIVQFALVEHAQHIAQTAASRALAAARAQGSSAAAGRAQAAATLTALGHGVLLGPAVTVQRSTRTATAVVRGEVEPLLPGLHLHVAAHAAGAVDRWTSPVGRQG